MIYENLHFLQFVVQ